MVDKLSFEDKKRELIKKLINIGIFPDKSILDMDNDFDIEEKFNEIIRKIENKKNQDINIKENKNNETTKNIINNNITNNKIEDKNKINIIFSYNKKPKQRSVKDFVSYFNKRYNQMKSFLLGRQELRNPLSIKFIRDKTGEVSVVGIVYDKQTTRAGNLKIIVEDPTGFVNVIINKNKKELFEQSKEIVLDEVIGVKGVVKRGSIFADNIIYPDIPIKEPKKTNDDIYAVFISDVHMGSKVFLKKEFENFISWLGGNFGDDYYKDIARKVGYVFVVGDLVEGIGVYPEQDKDIEIKDIERQYSLFSDYMRRIPKNIKIVLSPGNHDAVRLSEPQPNLYKDFAKELYNIENVYIVSNPAMVNIESKNNFPGIDVLLYHGSSFIYYANNVEYIRKLGGQDRVDLIMKLLLKKRHLAPTHTSTLYIPDETEDPLIIKKVPDIFATGHIHRVNVSNYKNTLLLNCSCWLGMTDYQERRGIIPHPARAIVVNLKTRETQILKFSKDNVVLDKENMK